MMQPPITTGTILQNRYQIVKILGQGGFGRTYLAEDQRRFNELCAIKELMTVVTGGYAWKKAKELFEREAAILYQIQHPQVPQFRERFEQDQRLFLVQDYVSGKTYRTLLSERQVSGSVFTEQEVLELMRSLLPVIEYIHNLGIIHRDIAPDNIILRDKDRLPVLIDFGVVKELATRLNSPDNTLEATSVGKFGYAPSEQLQTGRTYHSSDLYALAVTAIVLLTGKEPSELFDDNQLSWNWQRWVKVNPQFALTLNRMLSQKPSDRYQNATDVKEALQYEEQSRKQSSVSTPDLSNVQTIAVGHSPNPVPSRTPDRPDPVIRQPANRSILDNPVAVFAMTLVVIFLAGFGSWAFVKSIRDRSQTSSEKTSPQTFPSPVIPGVTLTPSPTPSSTPTPTLSNNQPVIYRKRLRFDTSNTINVEGTVNAQETILYSFRGEEGQKLSVLLAKEGGVLLTVLGSNQEPIDNRAQQVSFYQGTLPSSGRYTIQVSPVPGLDQTNYSFNVELENPVQPTPTQSPVDSTPTPTEITPTPTPTEITPTPTPTEITPTPTPTEIIPTPTPTEIIPTPTATPTEQS